MDTSSSGRVPILLFVIIMTLLLIMLEPVWVTGDVEVYMRMAQGEWVELPFRLRPLIPWIINFLGGSYETFVVFNILLFMVSMYIYSRIYGVGVSILFFFGTYWVLNVVIQTPMLESGIIFWIVCALWVSNKKVYFLSPFVLTMSFLTHPIALVLVTMIILTDKRLVAREPLVIPVIGIMFLGVILLYAEGYNVPALMQSIEIYATILTTIGVFWFGFATFNRFQPEGYRALLAVVLCIGFAYMGTYTANVLFCSVLGSAIHCSS